MNHRSDARTSLPLAAYALIAMWCVGSRQTIADDESLQTEGPLLIESRRIWDKASHNAFTDLLRFEDHWYCVFREGSAHVSPDGALRVITSSDGEQWKSLALIKSPTYDLRDAKLTATPDGRLMLNGAGMIAEAKVRYYSSHEGKASIYLAKVKILEQE